MWRDTIEKIPVPVRFALLGLGIVVLFIILSKWSERSRRRYTPQIVNGMRDAVKDINRLYMMSKQDANPLISLIHSTQALSQAKMAKNLLGLYDLTRVSDLDAEEWLGLLDDQEQMTLANVIHKAPSLMPPGNNFVSTSWLG